MAINRIKAAIEAGTLTEEDVAMRIIEATHTDGLQRYGLSQCWGLLGCSDANGYGVINLAGTVVCLHRLSWWLANGLPDMTSAMVVRHKCDNPACANPEHLEIGTQTDNIHDMFRRGRNKNLRITSEKVAEIRVMRDSGVELQKIAKAFGICREHLWIILNNKRKTL